MIIMHDGCLVPRLEHSNEYSNRCLSNRDLIALDCIGLHWIAFDCIGLHWIAFDCIWVIESHQVPQLLTVVQDVGDWETLHRSAITLTSLGWTNNSTIKSKLDTWSNSGRRRRYSNIEEPSNVTSTASRVSFRSIVIQWQFIHILIWFAMYRDGAREMGPPAEMKNTMSSNKALISYSWLRWLFSTSPVSQTPGDAVFRRSPTPAGRETEAEGGVKGGGRGKGRGDCGVAATKPAAAVVIVNVQNV